MKVNEIKPGSRVSISVFQDKSNKTENTGRKFETKLEDVTEQGVLVMQLPYEGGKLVALSTGLRYEFIFNTPNGFYNALGQVVRRYKKENFYFMDVVLTSPLEKYQRREYFRIECSLPALCIFLTSYEEEMESITDVERYLEDHCTDDFAAGFGSITNISGGGALFISSLDLQKGDFILLRVNFQKDEEDEEDIAELVCHVLDKSYDKVQEHFSYRLMFKIQDPKFRERIIHFVFEEERKIRRKVQG